MSEIKNKLLSLFTDSLIYEVKAVHKYEGPGGYWDWQDRWISGNYVTDVLYEGCFKNINDAIDMCFKQVEEIYKLEDAKGNIHEHYFWPESSNLIKDNTLLNLQLNISGYSVILCYKTLN